MMMMRYLIVAFFASAFVCTPISFASSADDGFSGDSFVVAGYLPDYRSYINVDAAAVHLTDLMLFSMTPESVLKFASSSPPPSDIGCCLSPDHFDLVRRAREHKKLQGKGGLGLLLTVGGGGRGNLFREIVMFESNQFKMRFIEALLELCRAEEFIGVDFDYEGIGSYKEWSAYLEFLKLASAHLHENELLITVALHPGQLLPSDVCESMDRVHVMTYDMAPPSGGQGGDERRSHHASIHSAKGAIAQFIQNGCPPSKLIMGIPAYARHQENMGLVQTYSEIVDDMMKSNDGGKKFVRAIHTWNGYQFDSPQDVEAKTRYAKENGLGGVFIWELGQDKQVQGADGGMLLEAAAFSASSGGGHIGMGEL